MPLKWKKIRTKVTEVCSLCVIVILSVFWLLLLVGKKKSVMQADSLSQQIRLVLCRNSFIFYSDEYDNDDEINEHQPFPSLSQVIYFLQLPKSLYSKATVFSDRVGEKVKATFFIPLYSQIFHAVPEHVGFNIEIKWICQMKVRIKCCQWCSHLRNKCSLGHLDMFLFALFRDRMGHGIATYHPTSTWTPTLISSCPVFCSKLDRDALSSPASTQTSAQC